MKEDQFCTNRWTDRTTMKSEKEKADSKESNKNINPHTKFLVGSSKSITDKTNEDNSSSKEQTDRRDNNTHTDTVPLS